MYYVFFFSSRRRHTRCSRDWSSDVCSSDLTLQGGKPFNRPTHVALCPKSGDVYVSDGYGNSRVHKYDPTGRHLHSWGAPGTDPGCFNVPHNLATDADGLVYVADRENHRVQVFDGKGQYLAQLSNLHRPCGLFAERRDG